MPISAATYFFLYWPSSPLLLLPACFRHFRHFHYALTPLLAPLLLLPLPHTLWCLRCFAIDIIGFHIIITLVATLSHCHGHFQMPCLPLMPLAPLLLITTFAAITICQLFRQYFSMRYAISPDTLPTACWYYFTDAAIDAATMPYYCFSFLPLFHADIRHAYCHFHIFADYWYYIFSAIDAIIIDTIAILHAMIIIFATLLIHAIDAHMPFLRHYRLRYQLVLSLRRFRWYWLAAIHSCRHCWFSAFVCRDAWWCCH